MVSPTVTAQLSTDFPYNGIGRPFPIRVYIPGGARGEASVQLLEPVTADIVDKARVTAGVQDLAKLFPDLWTLKRPKLVYAQLVVGDEKVGPALVLQPMLNPRFLGSRRMERPSSSLPTKTDRCTTEYGHTSTST